MSIKKTTKAVSGCLLALSASLAYCGTMGPAMSAPGKVYIGVFGGGGGISSGDINQYGTAYFLESEGGPLAVNAFGTSQSDATGIIGGHLGFAWPNMGTHLPITPAVELEGYYVGRTIIKAPDLRNDTDRLPEHDFLVTYPVKSGVFLVNAILNADAAQFGRFRPYVGVGIGSAVLSIQGATATQLSPAEPNVNHYNSDPNARAVAFAAQPKVGFHVDFSHASFFAEYRFLYLSETDYTFGSTVYATHAPTSPWLVKIKPQHYNMGTIGIDFDV